MRKLFLLFCFLIAGIGATPAFAQAPLATESFSIVSGAGQSGDGALTSDMVYDGVGPDGIAWTGGAVGVQGGSSITDQILNKNAPTDNPVPANVAFKFNVGSVVATLNSAYGAGNWTIANPTLYVQYTLYANNPRFGGGAGTFDIYWVANNNWAETESTTDNTNPPYASTAAALLAWSGGQSLLGSETYTWSTPTITGSIADGESVNWATDKTGPRQSTVTYSLSLDPLLVNEILSASASGNNSYVSLYLMGTSPTLGMTIYTGGGSVLPTLSFEVVPSIAVVPWPNYGYGSVDLDTSASNVFTVTNSGNANVDIGQVAVSGTNAAAFVPGTGAGDTCSNTSLAPWTSCTVNVTFTPVSSGSQSATVTIPTGDPVSPAISVNLTGTGVTGISVTPASLAFGNVSIGQVKDLSVSVANNGNLPLTIQSVRLSGDPSFSLEETISDGTVIPSGAQADTVTIEFTPPVQPASVSGTVTITSGDVAQPTITVNLTAASISTPTALLAITPSGTITYQNRDISQTTGYQTQTITVTSEGNLDLDIGQVTLDDATDFTIFSDTCSNTVVPFSGRGTCQIVVQFNPASAGLKTANLAIPSNTTNTDGTINQQSIVQFSGTGIKYGVSIAPAALGFGMILLPDDNELGNTPTGCNDNDNGTVSCTVTITNTGSAAVSNISLSTGNSPFTVEPSTISSTLAVGASASVAVTYTATNGETLQDTGTLTVYAGSDSDSIALTGVTATRPNTPVNGLPLDGTNVSLPVTLTSSAFFDADGIDTQQSATWEISTNSQFATGSTVFTSANDTNDLTSLKVPSGVVQQGVTYYWTVSYTDSRGAPSISSTVTSFTIAAVPMNQSWTTPLTMTVTDSSGHEITKLSDLASAVANGTASGQLLSDLGASAVINSGALFDPNSQSPTVAIIKESGGSSNDVLGIVTPAGINIDTVTTTVPNDPSFNNPPPSTWTFHNGLVSFKITGVTGLNNPAQVTFYTPTSLPANTVWFKYTPASGWMQINGNGTYDVTGTHQLSSATTFTVVDGKGVLAIPDNDLTNLSPENGVVLDPGGPAVPAPVASTPAAGSIGGGSNCFIATAAFGSYFNPYVKILRDFRDTFLLTNGAGSAFVAWYYRVSPSIADRIRTRESLRAGVRAVLMPAVGFSALCLKIGALPAMALTVLLLLIAATLVIAATRKLRGDLRR